MSFLAGWENFYVILGSAAGGLIGLTFVVIALMSDARRANPAGMRGYITPTIVHFGSVLALSALLSVPQQSVWCLSLGFGLTGVLGLVYTAVTFRHMHLFSRNYEPVLEDWIWHAIGPVLVYGALAGMALVIWHDARESLYGSAAALAALLFIAIHNAWDVAVSITVQKQKDAEKSTDSKTQRPR